MKDNIEIRDMTCYSILEMNGVGKKHILATSWTKENANVALCSLRLQHPDRKYEKVECEAKVALAKDVGEENFRRLMDTLNECSDYGQNGLVWSRLTNKDDVEVHLPLAIVTLKGYHAI